MKQHIIMGLAALLLAAPLTAGNAATDTLSVGDSAPRLTSVDWVKGGPVSDWEAGQVYVIDFWATWCGPCKASIPHVNDLANTYRDRGVTFIGAAIWPRKGMVPTNEFVADKGDAMSYLIAEDVEGATAETFMTAAGQGGIPTAMVIDKQGKLAWMGHPMDGLDEVVEAVVDDRFDAVSFEAEKAAKREKLQQMMSELNDAYRAENWDDVAGVAGRLIEFDAERNASLGLLRYQAYMKAGKAEAAAAWGREVVGGLLAENASLLNGLAWTIVDPEGDIEAAQRDLGLARLAGDRANLLTHESDSSILDTVARVAYLSGDLPGAIKFQNHAVELTDGEQRDQLAQTLQTYIDEFEASDG